MDSERNQALLCLGSNLDKEKNIERAAEWLRAYFVSIRFADPIYTESIGCPKKTLYLNQVAVLNTGKSETEIVGILKEIERSLGRKPEDKASGYVPIDIDLLSWNGRILKAEDMRRDYIISGIRSLLPARQENERRPQETE